MRATKRNKSKAVASVGIACPRPICCSLLNEPGVTVSNSVSVFRKSRPAGLATIIGALLLAVPTASHAALITFTAEDAPGVNQVAFHLQQTNPDNILGKSYIGYGVDFSWRDQEARGVGAPDVITGVDNLGVTNALRPRNGRIVLLNTLDQGVTDYIYLEADGGPNHLTFSAFNLQGDLIQSVTNPFNTPKGTYGHAGLFISAPGIAFFEITTSQGDLFGVHEVRLHTPEVGSGHQPPDRGPIPEPGTWALMILGFGAIGSAIRKRRAKAFALI